MLLLVRHSCEPLVANKLGSDQALLFGLASQSLKPGFNKFYTDSDSLVMIQDKLVNLYQQEYICMYIKLYISAQDLDI